MNILMALSQKELTGAESYACTIAKELKARGHYLCFVSDTLTLPAPGPFYRLRFNRRNVLQRIWHIGYLLWLFHRENIQLVHAHSRASAWSCMLACKIAGIPLVTTIHGRQKIHHSSQKRPMFGQAAIAVCDALAQHVRQDFPAANCPVYTIPNAIETQIYTHQPKIKISKKNKPILGIAGRLTGPKGELCYRLLTEVFDPKQYEIHIASASVVPERFQKQFKQVHFMGHIENMPDFYTRCDMVLGSGRVAMEAILCGKPTFAIGESHVLGWITPENIKQALDCNFGDIGKTDLNINFDTLVKTFQAQDITQIHTETLRATIRKHFDVHQVTHQIETVYQQTMVYFYQKEMPVLMYHRFIRDHGNAGIHGTWIDIRLFEKHLNWLRKKGYQTITFADLQKNRLISRFKRGKKFIMITVDDGYQDNLTELVPLLQKYNFKAVLYVVTGETYNRWDTENLAQVEKKFPLLTRKELAEIIASGCIEIGGHTHSHPHLTKLSKSQQHQEIIMNKQALEAQTQQKILSFAYPFGDYNQQTQEIVQKAGYNYAVATDSGPLAFHENLFCIRRIAIFPSTTLSRFRRKISGNYTFRKARS